jgi:hypothetical protein
VASQLAINRQLTVIDSYSYLQQTVPWAHKGFYWAMVWLGHTLVSGAP